MWTGMLLALALWWHGVHLGTGTVDYRSDSKRLEIVLTVNASHLEEVLRQKSGKEVELDRTPGVEKLAEQYIFSHWSVKDSSGQFVTLHWVGWEIKGGNVNCYVEATVAGDQGLRLRNEILLDWQRDQVNQILLKRDGKAKPPQLMYWVGNAGEHLPLTF